MADFKSQNNFKNFMKDFKTDTGLEATSNMPQYIAYFNARMTDLNYQFQFFFANQLLNKIGFLPDQIGTSVAQSLKAMPKGTLQ